MKLIMALLLCSTVIWAKDYKKPDDAALKSLLTPQQYECTQKSGTEKAFENLYWNNKADGIYVDVVSNEPLFSSLDKYDSGTGWPSFWKPLELGAIKMVADKSLKIERTEIKSSKAGSHLGHVFDDGPKDKGGKRFCVNSASLRFIAVDNLKKEGLGAYLFMFEDKKGWQSATLSGGCFWGVEELLRSMPGVIETQVGYAGGKSDKATYEDVKTGTTGHAESVQILFDPKKISYEDILLKFFKIHDPTTLNRQGNDVGSQYRSSIFYADDAQKKVAEKVFARVEASGQWKKPLTTEIVALKEFFRAEDYHQQYLLKQPNGYTCHFERKLTF
jgi:peptide methionine sulfoxide reductase msrA/msrB